jgi:integrase
MQDQRNAQVRRKLPTGIVERHSRKCRSRDGRKCDCRPSYRAWVFDSRSHQKVLKTFGTLGEAKRWRVHALSALQRGRLAPPSKRTLRDAWEEWYAGATAEPPTILTRSGRRFKPSVLRGYGADMRIYVLDEVGGLRLSDVRRRDLQAIIDRALGQGLSASKTRNLIMPMRALYRYALERDEIETNPTANLRLPSDLGVRERVAGIDEAEQLIRLLPTNLRAIYATAFFAGLRRGELQALRWSDVDLAGGVIRVARSWDAQAGYVEPKSRKGTRAVPIFGALRDYLTAEKARTGRDGHDLIFGSTASHPFTDSNIRRKAKRAWAVAAVGAFLTGKPFSPELQPIGLHELRHSAVTFMHEAGLSLEEIGDLVGHSSAYMSDRYRHLRHERRDQLAAKLDAYALLASSSARIEQVEEGV